MLYGLRVLTLLVAAVFLWRALWNMLDQYLPNTLYANMACLCGVLFVYVWYDHLD
jgi:hypothetical protein